MEQATQDRVLRDRVDALMGRLQAETHVALDEAVGAGDLGAIDVETTAAAMLAYLEGVLLIAKTRKAPRRARAAAAGSARHPDQRHAALARAAG